MSRAAMIEIKSVLFRNFFGFGRRLRERRDQVRAAASMDRIIIQGGRKLSGRIPISGAKNAALTLMPCALLSDEPMTLRNLPRLADVDGFGHLLNQLEIGRASCRERV